VAETGFATGPLAFFHNTVVTSNDNGAFEIGTLPPGTYRIAALETLDPGLTEAPQFLSRFEGSSVEIRLDEASKTSVTLVVVPYDAVKDAENSLP
jgi:hypothetical protein